MNVALDRSGWTHNAGMTAGWACGLGHTMGNRLTYSQELNRSARHPIEACPTHLIGPAGRDRFARLCCTDWNDEESKDGDAFEWGTYYEVLGPKAAGSKPVQLMKMGLYNKWESNGAPPPGPCPSPARLAL